MNSELKQIYNELVMEVDTDIELESVILSMRTKIK